MNKGLISQRSFCILSGRSGIAGVILLIVSFAINNGPPPDPSSAELVKFGQQHFATILWGAWLQAVSPVLIVLFAFALVHLAGAAQRLAGWMTFFGATILMTVSLIEITFYMSALNPDPAMMPSISLRLIYAVQHLYFIAGAPTLFLPLGIVLVSTSASVWISGAHISNRFCSLRGYFSAQSDAAWPSYGICWSPSALVVKRRHRTHCSQKKRFRIAWKQMGARFHGRSDLNPTLLHPVPIKSPVLPSHDIPGVLPAIRKLSRNGLRDHQSN